MSLLCLAHHAVRLWRSHRRWPRGVTNPVQIRWKSHVSFPLSWGRWPSLIRRNRSFIHPVSEQPLYLSADDMIAVLAYFVPQQIVCKPTFEFVVCVTEHLW